jgi:hypothetical protein
MHVQNNSVRFGMVVGPMSTQQSRTIFNRMRQLYSSNNIPVRELAFPGPNGQTRLAQSHYMIAGEADCFQLRQASQKSVSNNASQRDEGRKLLEKLITRAVPLEKRPRN